MDKLHVCAVGDALVPFHDNHHGIIQGRFVARELDLKTGKYTANPEGEVVPDSAYYRLKIARGELQIKEQQ